MLLTGYACYLFMRDELDNVMFPTIARVESSITMMVWSLIICITENTC